jgi:hypothetical protein
LIHAAGDAVALSASIGLSRDCRVDAAGRLGDHDGIDTLVVELGAKRAPAAMKLQLAWSVIPTSHPVVSCLEGSTFDEDGFAAVMGSLQTR